MPAGMACSVIFHARQRRLRASRGRRRRRGRVWRGAAAAAAAGRGRCRPARGNGRRRRIGKGVGHDGGTPAGARGEWLPGGAARAAIRGAAQAAGPVIRAERCRRRCIGRIDSHATRDFPRLIARPRRRRDGRPSPRAPVPGRQARQRYAAEAERAVPEDHRQFRLRRGRPAGGARLSARSATRAAAAPKGESRPASPAASSSASPPDEPQRAGARRLQGAVERQGRGGGGGHLAPARVQRPDVQRAAAIAPRRRPLRRIAAGRRPGRSAGGRARPARRRGRAAPSRARSGGKVASAAETRERQSALRSPPPGAPMRSDAARISTAPAGVSKRSPPRLRATRFCARTGVRGERKATLQAVGGDGQRRAAEAQVVASRASPARAGRAAAGEMRSTTRLRPPSAPPPGHEVGAGAQARAPARVRVAAKGQPPRRGGPCATCQPSARRMAAQAAKPSSSRSHSQRHSSAWPAARAATTRMEARRGRARGARAARPVRWLGGHRVRGYSALRTARENRGVAAPDPPRMSLPAPLPLDADGDLYVFAYGSLIWRPGFAYAAMHPALLRGFHRRFCIWSRLYRGTPEVAGPGARASTAAAPAGASPSGCRGGGGRPFWTTSRTARCRRARRRSTSAASSASPCWTAGARCGPSPSWPTGRATATAGRKRQRRRRPSRGARGRWGRTANTCSTRWRICARWACAIPASTASPRCSAAGLNRGFPAIRPQRRPGWRVPLGLSPSRTAAETAPERPPQQDSENQA